ncbi:MAG: hypothetical protein AAF322_03460, partial [Pseudomonadota bacterium]
MQRELSHGLREPPSALRPASRRAIVGRRRRGGETPFGRTSKMPDLDQLRSRLRAAQLRDEAACIAETA